MSEAKNESALSDLLGLLVVAELDAYYDGEYMDHSVVRERLRDFGRAVQAAERERWREAGWVCADGFPALRGHKPLKPGAKLYANSEDLAYEF
jgi:hypothetical protein